MSEYGWEAGTLKLSTKEFPKVRKALWEAANAQRAANLTRSLELWTALKRGAKVDDLSRNERDEDLVSRLFREQTATGWVTHKTPRKPMKKDFAPLPWKTVVFGGDEGTVRFDLKARTARWSVSENNRSVERARSGWLGRAFFTALNRVEWTRGTGGSIVGNDENNRDSDYEGGGGNYVTASYGPTPTPRGRPDRFFSSPVPTRYYMPPRRW
jgi:hypothetical protein